MTLQQAVSAVQSGFAQYRTGPHPESRQILSGGSLVNGNMPALYANEELAIEAWRDAMAKVSDKTKRIVWVDAPRVEAFRITIADRGQTHRVADDRYTVTCRFALEAVEK